MADDEEEQLLAAAEPEECSRRAMACVLCCVGAALLCGTGVMLLLRCSLSYDDPADLPAILASSFSAVLLLALGFSLSFICVILLVHMYVGDPERRRLVDVMLR